MVQFKNPLTNPRGFFSSQQGGFFAPPEGGRTLTGLIGDPRVNIGLAIAQGQPIGQAILGGALQAKQVRDSFKDDYGTTKQAYNPQTGEIVFATEEQIATQGLTPIPDAPEKPSERALRIEDIMTTFGINRAEAIKYDEGLIKLGDDKGTPVLIDTVSGDKRPVGQTISQALNESSVISPKGEDLIKQQTPEFMISAPKVIEKAYAASSRDDAILLSGAAEIGLDSAAEIAKILQEKPQIAGILGSIQRGGKSLFGVISDLQSIQGIPDVFNEQVLQKFSDPDISRIAILEEKVVNAMADTAAKKGGRTPTTALRDEQRNKLNLTGFTDSASVLTRLQEVAKELNKDAMQFQGVKGGYNTELYGDRVKDYSVDPAYGSLFQPTRIRIKDEDLD